MPQRKMTEDEKKYIIRQLKTVLYWQLETATNIQQQYLGLTAPMFLATNLHDLALYVHNIDIDPDEWEDLYMTASDEARHEYFNKDKKNENDEIDS